MTDNKFQILSLDGGGIKGIFSVAVLAQIEKDLNINIVDHFDLIAGTSTGGIIALGLGLGLKPEEILNFYLTHGTAIFKKNKVTSIRKYFKSKYSNNFLQKALIECFGDNKLGNSTKRLIIPSYNIGEDDVYVFKTSHHERLRRDYKEYAWKIGLATSAAPTYFPVYRGISDLRLVDGGVWANNPSMIALVEAISLLNYKVENIKIFSLGTTDETVNYSTNLNNGGIKQWVEKNSAIKLIMRSQSISAHNMLNLMFPKENYLRLNPKVPENIFGIDKTKLKLELLGKAKDKSRRICPDFKKIFMNHIAPQFKPLYQEEK